MGDRADISRRLLLGGSAAALTAGPIALARRQPSADQASTLPAAKQTFIIEPSWTLAWRKGDFQLLRDHSVVISEGRIAELRSGHRVGREFRLRCPGQLLLPGFISGHTHTNIVDLGRGVVGLRGRAGNPIRLADLIGDEDRDALTRYRLIESLRGGCTTRFEQALSLAQAKSHFAAAERYDTREYLSAMTPGWSRLFPIWFRDDDQVLFDSEPDTLAEIAAIRAWAATHNNSNDGRIRMQMGPHAPNTLTPAAMRAVAAGAAELGYGIHTHLSQDRREIEDIQRLWGKKPAQWIDEFGWYDEPLIVAHLRAMDPVVELPLLKEKGATFGYCPWQGGMDGATRPRWWPEVLAADMNASIGLEFSNDFVETIKLAVFYGGARYSLLPYPDLSPVPLEKPSIWDALRAATVNGAAVVGREDLGRIQVGALADLVSVDVTGLLVGSGAVPPQPVYHLLFANGLSVVNTLTEGKFQIHQGQVAIDDAAQLAKRAAGALEKIWRQSEEAGWFDPATR